MDLPNFVCIGAQKAGTTWLHEMLAQHPDVWQPPLKELHYFSHAARHRNRIAKNNDSNVPVRDDETLDDEAEASGDNDEGPGDEQTSGQERVIKAISKRLKAYKRDGRPEGEAYEAYLRSLISGEILSEDWYRRVYSWSAAAGKVKGDITPAYLIMNSRSIEYLKSLLDNPKIILIIREPASRLVSQIKMNIGRKNLELTDRPAWERFLERAANRRKGSYAVSVPKWQEHFDEKRLLILPFGDIKRDPAEFMRVIEAHIGVKPYGGYYGLSEVVHPGKEVIIPDWVQEWADERTKPQQDYLRTAFGEDFYEKTK